RSCLPAPSPQFVPPPPPPPPTYTLSLHDALPIYRREILAIDTDLLLQEPEDRRRPLRGKLPVGGELLAESSADRHRIRIPFDSDLFVFHRKKHVADFGQNFFAFWLDLRPSRIEENLLPQLHLHFV